MVFEPSNTIVNYLQCKFDSSKVKQSLLNFSIDFGVSIVNPLFRARFHN
jgi:hypothetical protein